MLNEYTSTGAKFFYHQEAMAKLRNGVGQPIVTHIMLTDVCNHTCAFCSVQARAGDSLPWDTVTGYLETLQRYGLRAVILSGGGNPILYKRDGRDFNDVVDWIHSRGLEIGLITNGMPLKRFCYHRMQPVRYILDHPPPIEDISRNSWVTVHPNTLDKLTWIRISMSGLDHEEREVYVPDVGPNTTLGFSYVGHDLYIEPADPHHGKVSTRADLLSGDRAPDWTFEERFEELREQFYKYCQRYQPRYLRLLPNCLEPPLIPRRVEQLQAIADMVNHRLRRNVLFVQNKPPKAPHACYLGYVHPVLNCDGYVYPCDSCVLNEAAEHQFANPWRVCRWDEVASLYERPVRSLIADPAKTCPGCVFPTSNAILESVVLGAEIPAPTEAPTHANFV